MSWSRLEENFSQHPKVLRLAELLGCSKHEARGVVVTLWNWTVRFAKDGDLSVATPREIELALEWEGKPGALIRALVKVRLLDKSDETGELSVHNWMRYADAWKAAQKKHTQRYQADRAQVSRDSPGTVPPTGPDRTRKEKRRPDQTRARAHDPTETTQAPAASAELRLLPVEGAPDAEVPRTVLAFGDASEAWAAVLASARGGEIGRRVLEQLDDRTRHALAAIGGSSELARSREAHLSALLRTFQQAYDGFGSGAARGEWRARVCACGHPSRSSGALASEAARAPPGEVVTGR